MADNSGTFYVALFGFLGVLVGTLGQIVIHFIDLFSKKRTKRQRAASKDGPSAAYTRRSLLVVRLFSIVIFLLSCISLVYLLTLPKQENIWFVRINEVLAAVSALSCAALFILPVALVRQEAETQRLTERKVWIIAFILFFGVLFTGVFGLLGVKFVRWQQEPVNVRLVVAAWDEYNKANYLSAIEASDKCIDRFGRQATKVEAGLAGTPPPHEGPATEVEKAAINQNGVLNDVATCYWIKGNSALQVQQVDVARSALASACDLTHALTYDPKGFFWSPSVDACDRLHDIK